jgi:hypothetical protein
MLSNILFYEVSATNYKFLKLNLDVMHQINIQLDEILLKNILPLPLLKHYVNLIAIKAFDFLNSIVLFAKYQCTIFMLYCLIYYSQYKI